MKLQRILALAAILVLSACGGGGGSGTDTRVPDGSGATVDNGPVSSGDSAEQTVEFEADAQAGTTPIGKPAASRFLAQASFGGTPAEITSLGAAANYNAWFTQQAAATPCLELPRVRQQLAAGVAITPAHRVEAWWYCAMTSQDQLRQRMAYALSQILVVSDMSNLGPMAEGMAYYSDLLRSNALGNYRVLLGAIARSPEMGLYLNMFGSQKPNAATGVRADENFARELMQLFTVGLVQLNANGTPKLSGGKPIATYTQTDVEQLARVLTGWGFPGGNFVFGTPQWTVPMQPTAAYHDTAMKTILGGVMIPSGLDANTELDMALDTLFAHPNVPPFISRQLIQRLVSSNPSDAYVARVAKVFVNNGAGVRGDLMAVARAILTDTEARNATVAQKVREPLLRLVHLWRAFDGRSANGRYEFFTPFTEGIIAQAPLRSPSVFNFYRPDYKPAGALTAANVAAPELQIVNEATINAAGNLWFYLARNYRSSRASTAADAASVTINYVPFEAYVNDSAAMINEMDLLLTGSRTSAAVKKLIAQHVASLPNTGAEDRIGEALDLLMHAPQTAVQ